MRRPPGTGCRRRPSADHGLAGGDSGKVTRGCGSGRPPSADRARACSADRVGLLSYAGLLS
jgi:hypothetical protein